MARESKMDRFAPPDDGPPQRRNVYRNWEGHHCRECKAALPWHEEPGSLCARCWKDKTDRAWRRSKGVE